MPSTRARNLWNQITNYTHKQTNKPPHPHSQLNPTQSNLINQSLRYSKHKITTITSNQSYSITHQLFHPYVRREYLIMFTFMIFMYWMAIISVLRKCIFFSPGESLVGWVGFVNVGVWVVDSPLFCVLFACLWGVVFSFGEVRWGWRMRDEGEGGWCVLCSWCIWYGIMVFNGMGFIQGSAESTWNFFLISPCFIKIPPQSSQI